MMTAIIMVILLYAIGFFALWTYYLAPSLAKSRRGDDNAVYIILLTALSAAVHVICAVKYQGHATDMNCFNAWSDMVFDGGFGNFYSSDAFTDYPPGYMYVLYLIGAVRSVFSPQDGSLWLLLKLPAIICDLAAGLLIYKIARRKFNTGISSAAAGAYLLNPAVILNSSLWGQVDGVYTLFILLMLYFLTNRDTVKSYFAFAVCIFIKPQSFIFTPLLIFGIIENVFLPKFDRIKFIKNLLWGLGAIALIVLLALPFGLKNVTEQYTETLASYPYLTVNAFNLWGALGQNWTELGSVMSVVNYFILALIVAYTAYVFFKTKNEGRYYFCGALLSFAVFMLSAKMHDRYAFPAMALLLTAFLYMSSPRGFIVYALSTLTQFFNTAWVLFIYEQDINKYFKSPVIVAASLINLAFFAYCLAYAQKYYAENKAAAVLADKSKNAAKANRGGASKQRAKSDAGQKGTMRFKRSAVYEKLGRFDYIVMASLMVVYGAIAFYNLGDTKAPQTFVDIGGGNSVEIDLGAERDISELKIYLGSYELSESRRLSISYCDENNADFATDELTSGAVFYWSEQPVNKTARYLRLSTNGEHLSVMELGIVDENGEYITPANAAEPSVSAMFDEQDTIPERSSFMNSTYFDEIYHARTGYEFVHGLDVYEWTHPPLGKDLIALGIALFGMTPFGWRCVGTFFGVLMIPVIYLFARRLLKYKWAAALAAVLFTFDFMHFAQTRIATIDVYVTFFIMLMYYFMYKYCTMSFYDTPVKKTLVPLALCGISMGLGIASKWTGIYAGVGLAVIFFVSLYMRYREYLYAKKDPKGTTDGISHKHVIESFEANTRITIFWCCIFFVFVPLLIYGLSYIPYLRAPGSEGIKTIIDNQNAIFTYHSKTVVESTHPYSSKWYEWIVMTRPIWYYSGEISDTIKEGISSFGNPLVWWIGIPAFFITLYNGIANRSKRAWFLVIAYAIQIVFWIPVTRTTFIYHYFPCVPFIALMIGYCMEDIYGSAGSERIFGMRTRNGGISGQRLVIICCCVYAAAAAALFAAFYPVLSGAPCSVDYADHLRWFDTWVLLAS
ncbi:MAG TPA: glycosyltransferase family 39 protein [Candidatus Ornithomonoglobus intestinigallinarum]|uniref:Polyprenol-phosphate-mannose--protein mannosyltransferase n=1 Tax=Candidatus Ornithomonoglobus intestinigallinarum TaxID=2840894 RepID=A0A9D1H342_9FIRM|nr:glycosyltransferase family 39 protein [Candidatus Ornithomonoglobus intestinigallinarum]